MRSAAAPRCGVERAARPVRPTLPSSRAHAATHAQAPEYCHGLDEESILRHQFELVFALDEVISLGYRENVNMVCTRTRAAPADAPAETSNPQLQTRSSRASRRIQAPPPKRVRPCGAARPCRDVQCRAARPRASERCAGPAGTPFRSWQRIRGRARHGSERSKQGKHRGNGGKEGEGGGAAGGAHAWSRQRGRGGGVARRVLAWDVQRSSAVSAPHDKHSSSTEATATRRLATARAQAESARRLSATVLSRPRSAPARSRRCTSARTRRWSRTRRSSPT
jgi:hypothetical protein